MAHAHVSFVIVIVILNYVMNNNHRILSDNICQTCKWFGDGSFPFFGPNVGGFKVIGLDGFQIPNGLNIK